MAERGDPVEGANVLTALNFVLATPSYVCKQSVAVKVHEGFTFETESLNLVIFRYFCTFILCGCTQKIDRFLWGSLGPYLYFIFCAAPANSLRLEP
jgi:hypothetical protein